MTLDVLILDSGEWVLREEKEAWPWHILVYGERREPRNELHLRLPHEGVPRSGEFAFRRIWMEGHVRWSVDLPPDPRRGLRRGPSGPRSLLVRFTDPEGHAFLAEHFGSRGLADLSAGEMLRLRETAVERSVTAI
jgi:hypothetical protein